MTLRGPLIVTALSGLGLVLVFALLPVSTTFRGAGSISEANGTAVVRAPKAGQLIEIQARGVQTVTQAAVAVIDHPLQTEGGRNPGHMAAQQLKDVSVQRSAEMALVKERHKLAALQNRERETSIRDRLANNERALSNMTKLSEDTTRLSEKLSSQAAGFVTRIDELAIAERAVNAKNRELDLRSESSRLRSELIDIERARRIQDIDMERDLAEIHRRHHAQEAVLLERSANQRFSIPSPISGDVLATFKRIGDWVDEGEELMLVGAKAGHADAARIRVPIPPELANLIHPDQVARIWANPKRRSDPPLIGRVARVDERTELGSADKAVSAGGVGSSFVAEVTLDPGQLISNAGLNDLRIGSLVEVEIVFGSQPLYEAIMPRRAMKRRVGTVAGK